MNVPFSKYTTSIEGIVSFQESVCHNSEQSHLLSISVSTFNDFTVYFLTPLRVGSFLNHQFFIPNHEIRSF